MKETHLQCNTILTLALPLSFYWDLSRGCSCFFLMFYLVNAPCVQHQLPFFSTFWIFLSECWYFYINTLFAFECYWKPAYLESVMLLGYFIGLSCYPAFKAKPFHWHIVLFHFVMVIFVSSEMYFCSFIMIINELLFLHNFLVYTRRIVGHIVLLRRMHSTIKGWGKQLAES